MNNWQKWHCRLLLSSEHNVLVLVSTKQNIYYYFPCFVLFIAERHGAGGQGYCQGGFSADFTKVRETFVGVCTYSHSNLFSAEISLCTPGLHSLFETPDETPQLLLATVVSLAGWEGCTWRTRQLLLARWAHRNVEQHGVFADIFQDSFFYFEWKKISDQINLSDLAGQSSLILTSDL